MQFRKIHYLVCFVRLSAVFTLNNRNQKHSTANNEFTHQSIDSCCTQDALFGWCALIPWQWTSLLIFHCTEILKFSVSLDSYMYLLYLPLMPVRPLILQHLQVIKIKEATLSDSLRQILGRAGIPIHTGKLSAFC